MGQIGLGFGKWMNYKTMPLVSISTRSCAKDRRHVEGYEVFLSV